MASFSPTLPSQPHSAPWPHLASPPLTSLTLIFSQSPLIQSPSLSFTHQPTPTLTLTLMMWWLLFVTKEHRIVRLERCDDRRMGLCFYLWFVFFFFFNYWKIYINKEKLKKKNWFVFLFVFVFVICASISVVVKSIFLLFIFFKIGSDWATSLD